MADINPAFMEQVFHVRQRQRKPHIHHEDDLGGGFEVTKWVLSFHQTRVGIPQSSLKPVSSDIALKKRIGANQTVFYECYACAVLIASKNILTEFNCRAPLR